MNLVSHLAAADCASGVTGNIDISKHTHTIIYHQQDPDDMGVMYVIYPRYFSNLLHHIIEDKISFASGNHINFIIAKHSDTVISHNDYKIWL